MGLRNKKSLHPERRLFCATNISKCTLHLLSVFVQPIPRDLRLPFVQRKAGLPADRSSIMQRLFSLPGAVPCTSGCEIRLSKHGDEIVRDLHPLPFSLAQQLCARKHLPSIQLYPIITQNQILQKSALRGAANAPDHSMNTEHIPRRTSTAVSAVTTKNPAVSPVTPPKFLLHSWQYHAR